MPYVNCMVTKEINKNDMERLKVHIGDLINNMPGKSEDWLFIRFCGNENLYYKGVKREEAAIVEVKILGSQDIKVKDKFTSNICQLLEDELGIPKEHIYVIFYEIPDGNWGWNGELF